MYNNNNNNEINSILFEAEMLDLHERAFLIFIQKKHDWFINNILIKCYVKIYWYINKRICRDYEEISLRSFENSTHKNKVIKHE